MRYDSHELQSTRTDKMQRLGDLANLPFTSLCFILLYFDSRTCMDLYYPLTLVSFCFRFCTRPCLWRKLALQSFYPSIAESWKYRVHIPWQLCYLQVNDVGTKLQDLWRLTTIWHYCWEINVRLGRSQKLLKWLHWSCDISNMLMQAALSSIWFW